MKINNNLANVYQKHLQQAECRDNMPKSLKNSSLIRDNPSISSKKTV